MQPRWQAVCPGACCLLAADRGCVQSAPRWAQVELGQVIGGSRWASTLCHGRQHSVPQPMPHPVPQSATASHSGVTPVGPPHLLGPEELVRDRALHGLPQPAAQGRQRHDVPTQHPAGARGAQQAPESSVRAGSDITSPPSTLWGCGGHSSRQSLVSSGRQRHHVPTQHPAGAQGRSRTRGSHQLGIKGGQGHRHTATQALLGTSWALQPARLCRLSPSTTTGHVTPGSTLPHPAPGRGGAAGRTAVGSTLRHVTPGSTLLHVTARRHCCCPCPCLTARQSRSRAS